jgi:hypothetical protein
MTSTRTGTVELKEELTKPSKSISKKRSFPKLTKRLA